MIIERSPRISEATIYSGFDTFTRTLLNFWKTVIIKIDDGSTTKSAIDDINQSLGATNAIILFDHHYAFDAIPITFALGKVLRNVSGVVIPYAVHLDMALDPDGFPSPRYKIRTLAFHRLVGTIQEMNPTIRFYPVVREFERENLRLNAVVEAEFRGANTRYLKGLLQVFYENPAGQLCILSPVSGIAFPHKPVLHTQVYRSLEAVQQKCGQAFPFYFVGGYPHLKYDLHYLAPLLTKHTVVARGPFYLPMGNYDKASAVVRSHLLDLRQAANFATPDYARIEHK